MQDFTDLEKQNPKKITENLSTAQPQEFSKIHLFSTHGRIGRIRFFMWLLILYLGFGSIMAIVVVVHSLDIFSFRRSGLFFIALFILFSYGHYSLFAQRLHDLNLSSWYEVLSVLPVINIILLGILFLKPGTKKANKYGNPPSPNSFAFKIIFGILVICISVVLVNAISKIPETYESYVKRL